jgi:hypothetical protein
MTDSRKPVYLPSTSKAEGWVAPDTFIWRGWLYQVTDDCKVILSESQPPHRRKREMAVTRG